MTEQTRSNPPICDGIVVRSLSSFLQMFGESDARLALNDYESYMESDTQAFLRNRAIEMEKSDISRTFLAITEEEYRIMGYFTIGIKCIRIPEDNELSGKKTKAINIDPKTCTAQSYLLGQLSRSKEAPKGLGKWLIAESISHIKAANNEVGCRMLRLDCHDELVEYYKKNGFSVINRSCGTNSLNQMMTILHRETRSRTVWLDQHPINPFTPSP